MHSRADDELFRSLVGAEEAHEDSPEEVATREERLGRGEGTLADAFAVLPAIMERRKRHYLDLYGLNDAYTEEEDAHAGAMLRMMSGEQEKEYSRARNAYLKRELPMKDKHDPLNTLRAFAATNPPEVLRRHVWRLQRGLDEPLFGRGREKPLQRVREYAAVLAIKLCDQCAGELKDETASSGAERERCPGLRQRNPGEKFYDSAGVGGFYLFKHEDMFVQRERGTFFYFPSEEPNTCGRCGVTDVDLWRERFGNKE